MLPLPSGHIVHQDRSALFRRRTDSLNERNWTLRPSSTVGAMSVAPATFARHRQLPRPPGRAPFPKTSMDPGSR